MKEIPTSDRAAEVNLTNGEFPSVKTLGILWKAKEDIFTFKNEDTGEMDRVYTKRSFLKRIATIFDPLGFLTPFVILGKILLQQVWLTGLDWDEPLPIELSQKISKWALNLKELSKIQVPRCLQKKEELKEVSIHVFNDASEEAYGSVVYQRTAYLSGNISVRMVLSKSRVAPLQATSIPRLELMSAVLGKKLAKKIIKAYSLKMGAVTFWCDNMNVLWWIRGMSRRFKSFVANRVGDIQSATDPSQWRYISTTDNPSDLVTRGASIDKFCKNELWIHGPAFLHQSEEYWPEKKFVDPPKSLPETKRKVAWKETEYTLLVTPSKTYIWHLDPKKYSSWTKLVRVNAWIERFIHNCLQPQEERDTKDLSMEEIKDSQMQLIKKLQQDEFIEEYKCLLKKREVQTNSKIISLYPKLDENGIIRSSGRLENAEYLDYDTKYPIILPRGAWITKLIVRDYHDKGQHVSGTNQTLAKLSTKFWIIRAREEIREYENQCYECKRRKARCTNQLMAPLPAIRLKEPLQAFARASVDFGGPFITIQGRGRKRVKRYLCLFTCLLSRAVHLEIAYSLDTDSFLNAFYRMTSRRGLPQEMMSDNGTNFVGAQAELQDLVKRLDQEKIKNSLANKGIKWHFNPPSGPHFGGVHETMIKAAKKAIYSILGNADINDEELMTAFVGAEDLINSRPLTYQSANIKDDLPLTPNHFLHGRIGGEFAPENVDETSYNMKKRWRRIQELEKHFWKRWITEWLPELNKRRKWLKGKRDLKIGDVVMVLSPNIGRGKWQIGRVTETYPGKDNHVRVVKVKVNDTEYVRPISKLSPLECDIDIIKS